MEIIAGRFVVDASWKPYVGEMSKVVRAADTQNSLAKVAVKIFDKDAFQQKVVAEAFSRECESLEKLSAHENIARLVDVGRDPANGCNYLALEWCDFNLTDYIAQHPESTWEGFYRRFGADILSALRFAYSQDVLHRDVKPQNILVTNEGRVCVSDFGISKFRRYYRPGVTLAHFKSAPYAPPEKDSDYPDTRDVYSYAVLCIECLYGAPLDEDADVVAVLSQVQVPDEIRDILRDCLSLDPGLRPGNVEFLGERLDAAMTKAARLASITREIPVHLTNAVLDAMCAVSHLLSHDHASEFIIRELNEVCGIDRFENAVGDAEPHLAFYTAEFRFRAVIDHQRNALSIIGLTQFTSSRAERLREEGWQPLLRFAPAGYRGDAEAMDWLENELAEFLTQRTIQKNLLAETGLFDRWSATLRAKEAIENYRKEPIRYSAVEVDGARLLLRARHSLGDSIAGQQRMISLGGREAIHGEVERTDGDVVVLYCGQGQNLSRVPSHGTLELDVRQSEIALKRQIAALDAVRFGRNTRPDLRDILTGKKVPAAPILPAELDYFQSDLDEDKKHAVRAALGAGDLLVVEGPPGTGKTKFITELVAQVLRKKPDARILLTSQTNVALDHALVNIEKLSNEKGLRLRAVRIARRDDEKVSQELSHLLLDRCVSRWLNEATARSDDFLRRWAEQNEISPQNVMIGIALAEIRACRARVVTAATLVSELSAELNELDADRVEIGKDKSRGDEYRVIVADIRTRQADLTEAEETLEAARHSLQSATDKAAGFPELADQLDTLSDRDLDELEHAYVNHASNGPSYRKLVQLAEEWRQRFGRSSDFHGAFVSDCDLIGGTCLGVAGHSLQSVDFDLCIVDEASKATPTEMLVPMGKSRKWVVVGDPNQLPPFFNDSREARYELERQGINRSDARHTLLDHFIETIPKVNQLSLLTQHRMVKPIGDLVSECFYSGQLNNVNTKLCPWLSKALALPRPVTWFNTALHARRREIPHRGTYVNDAELEVIESLLLRLQLAASKRKAKYSVALLSGYGGQVAALERMATSKRRQLPDLMLETGTVDSYQGREADVAVYSVTRSNPEREIGFLKEQERLNVALSRAKLGLAIVGDATFCAEVSGRNPFTSVLTYIHDHPTECTFQDVQA